MKHSDNTSELFQFHSVTAQMSINKIQPNYVKKMQQQSKHPIQLLQL